MRDYLAALKAEESADQAAVLVDAPELHRIISAWPRFPIGRKQHGEPNAQDSAPAKWALAWSLCTVDMDALGDATGLGKQRAERAFRQCVGAGLIYPDGTANRYARQYLSALVAKAIPRHLAGKRG